MSDVAHVMLPKLPTNGSLLIRGIIICGRASFNTNTFWNFAVFLRKSILSLFG